MTPNEAHGINDPKLREKITEQLKVLKKMMKPKPKNELIRIIQQMSIDLWFSSKAIQEMKNKYEPKESEAAASPELSKEKEIV